MPLLRRPWSPSHTGLDKLRPWFTLNAREIRWLCAVLALILLGMMARAIRQRRAIPTPVPPPATRPAQP